MAVHPRDLSKCIEEKTKADVHRSQNVITQKNGKNKNERIFSRFSLSLFSSPLPFK